MAKALGFLIGGALQGAGQGLVQASVQRWQQLLSDLEAQRADARAEKQMAFTAQEGEKTRAHQSRLEGERQFAEMGKLATETKTREKEFGVRTEEARAQREDTAAYRDATRRETERHNRAMEDATQQRRDLTDKDYISLIIEESTDAAGRLDEAKAKDKATRTNRPTVMQYFGVTETPSDGKRPPKPEEYPNAQWDERGKQWVVRGEDGRWRPVVSG